MNLLLKIINNPNEVISIGSHQFKVGGDIKRVYLKVTKQWNVSKTIGGEYGSRF